MTIDPERLRPFMKVLASYCPRGTTGADQLFERLFGDEGADRVEFEQDLNAILFFAGGRVEAHVVLDTLVTKGLVRIKVSTLFAVTSPRAARS